MKSHGKILVVVSFLFLAPLICTGLLADEKVAEESKQANWGWSHNEGDVDVILHVKMEGGRYTDLILPAGGKMILPKGTVKVKVVPMKPTLEETDKLEVDIRPAYYGPNIGWPRITEPGKSRTFPEPTDAIPVKERSHLDADVLVPPGASEPEPEGALPSDWELPDESEKESEQAGKFDRQSQLRELNELYMKYSRRLTEIEPDSEEAKQIREALTKYGRDIDRYMAEEEAEHGPDWIEALRDKQTGKLPGGILEDTKSKLVKLKEEMEKQREKNTKLEEEFKKLKDVKPVPDWKEYLNEKRNELREEFVKKYGESSEWDDDERAEYQKKYNEMADKVRGDWEKEKKAESENNRKLGKIIKQLAEEKAKLNEMEEEVEQLEKEQPSQPEETAQPEGPNVPEDEEFDLPLETDEIGIEAELRKEKQKEYLQEHLQFTDDSGRVRSSYSTDEQMFLKFYTTSPTPYLGYYAADVTNVRTGVEQEIALVSPTGKGDSIFKSEGFSPSSLGAQAGDKIVAKCRSNVVSIIIKGSEEEEAKYPQLVLRPSLVIPGGRLTLTYKNAPGNNTDWVNLAKTSWPAKEHGEYYYLEGKKEGTLTFTAFESGNFEARLYENWPFGGHKIIAWSNTVEARLPSGEHLVLRPKGVQTGEPVIFSYSGVSDNQNVWVTLVKVTAPTLAYGQVYYLDEGQTSGTFRFIAPEPGEYEVRIFKVSENKIIGQSNSITVFEKEQKKEEIKEGQDKKISVLDGTYRGDDFEWGHVTIKNGNGNSSFGQFEVQRKKFVYKDGEHTKEYEFSGTWSRGHWSWSGVIALNRVKNGIEVVWEKPPGYGWGRDYWSWEGPLPEEKDLPEEEQKEQPQEKPSVEER